MQHASLLDRVTDLERRIDCLESKLGMAPPPIPRPAVPMQRAVPRMAIPVESPRPVSFAEQGAPTAAPAALAYQTPPPAPSPTRRPREVEQFIGLKLAAWVGAIVLVIGMAFGLKFAYDQGWFGLMPPVLRVAMMYAGAFGLIGAGEVVYRRVNERSAVGLYAAGVAALFLISFAGHRFYGLYSPNAAFVLMAISTLVGAAVAARGNLVSIASLSLLGANAIPIILASRTDNIVPFLSYLLALQGITLALSGKGASGKWWLLRAQGFATAALWLAGIVLNGTSQTSAVMGFGLLYAALFQIELALSAWRSREGSAEAAADSTFCTFITAGAFALVYCLTQSHFAHGAAALGFAVCTALSGAAIRRIGNRPRLRALAVAYLAQSAALVVLSVPLMFSGMTILSGWLVLATVFAVTVHFAKSRIASVSAVCTWALAVGKLWVFWMTPHSGMDVTWLAPFGTAIPAYVVLAGAVMFVGHAVAWLIDDRASAALSAGAAAVFVLAAIAGVQGFGATTILVLYAWVLAGADVVTKRLSPVGHAVAVLLIAMLKWAVVDSLGARLAPTWSAAAYSPMFNPMIRTGALIAGSMLGIYAWRRESILSLLSASDDRRQSTLRLAMAGTIVVIVTLALSLDIDGVVERIALSGSLGWPMWPVKQLAWTMLWTASAAGLAIVAGRIAPSAEPGKKFGAFMLFIAGKFIVVDALFFRVFYGAQIGLPFANLECATAAVVAAALVVMHLYPPFVADDPRRERFLGRVSTMLATLVLVTGTLEIERMFAASPGVARQFAYSIYWAVFAVLLVMARFGLQRPNLRYYALTVYGVTLVKVMLIDLAGIGTGYRILSFIGVGGLLLATSVVYGKVSPRLLKTAGGG